MLYSGTCTGDSGAPLWIEGTEKIAAVFFGRRGVSPDDDVCGKGWGLAVKLTQPNVWNWIHGLN